MQAGHDYDRLAELDARELKQVRKTQIKVVDSFMVLINR